MRAAILAVLSLLAGCAALPDVAPGECGNGVLEPAVGEECDGVEGCGAPDAVGTACKLICDELGAGCPDGWGCGHDRRCRRPTETFASGEAVAMPGAGVSVVDMDDDGAADVLGYDSRGLVTRYGDATGEMSFQTRLPLPYSETGSVTPDADGDEQRDLAVPLADGGWALFTNGGARTLSPAAQSAIALDLPGACVPLTVGAALGGPANAAEMLMSIGGQDLRFIEKDECGFSPDCVLSPGGALLDQEFHTAALGYGPADGIYDGEQFTALVEGQDKISVWGHDLLASRPKRLDTWTLPEPVSSDGHVAFLELDGDACTDLVVDTGTSLAVVFGRRDLSGACLGLAHQAGVALRFDRPIGPIIGNGRLAGDSDSLLYTIAVAIGQPGAGNARSVVAAYTFDGAQFRSDLLVASDGYPHAAAILDYNRDGLPDVALALDGGSTVDFYLNYAGQGFNAFPVDVGGAPRRPVVGDFDGDLFPDLVVAVADPTNPSGRDRMYIVYGDPSGHPPPAQFVGDFVAATTTTPILGGTQQHTASLIVVSNKLPTDTSDVCDRRIAILLGDTARQLVSPYVVLYDTGTEVLGLSPLATFDVSSPGLPQVLAVGKYTDTATGEAHVVASLLGFDDDAFTTLDVTLELPASLPDYALRSARWRAADLNGDGQTDGVAIAGAKLAVVQIDPAGIHAVVQDLPPELQYGTWFELVDMDGDGDRDILGAASGAFTTLDVAAPAGAYWVLWNDGAGGFVASAPTELAMPDSLYCFAAAVIHSNDTGDPQVLGACYSYDGAAVGDVVLALSTFDPARDPDHVSDVRVLPLASSASAVQVGDVTGDGLEDIAVLGGGSMTIYRQCVDGEVGTLTSDTVVADACAGFLPR